MLPPFWQKVSLFNPVVYLISGFRWSFYGVADVDVGISLRPRSSASWSGVPGAVWWIFRPLRSRSTIPAGSR
jgi:ABC-2 type transport system permease protein